MATTTVQQEANTRKAAEKPQKQLTSDPNPTARDENVLPSKPDNAPSTQQRPPSVTGMASAGKEGSTTKTVAAAKNDKDDVPVSDVQKKIRRAERFGTPVVLSEQEKRDSRAERFGTGSVLHGSEALKKSEEQKRKARAERFGLSVPADEEAKKKARLARFSAVPKKDAQEEEKRKARALRFSQPPSGSISQVNGKDNIESETAIAGKAGGGS